MSLEFDSNALGGLLTGAGDPFSMAAIMAAGRGMKGAFHLGQVAFPQIELAQKVQTPSIIGDSVSVQAAKADFAPRLYNNGEPEFADILLAEFPVLSSVPYSFYGPNRSLGALSSDIAAGS